MILRRLTENLRAQNWTALDPAEAARAALALRAHPELVPELNWHLASVANYLTNVDGLESAFRALDESLKKRS